MKRFYVTFGIRYREEPHPVAGVHPDGWVEIVAADENAARELAFATFGRAWASIYDREPKSEYHPLGCLFEVRDEG